LHLIKLGCTISVALKQVLPSLPAVPSMHLLEGTTL
jgi:hypothetical protein